MGPDPTADRCLNDAVDVGELQEAPGRPTRLAGLVVAVEVGDPCVRGV